MAKLDQVQDPELGMSIVDLGLIYDVEFDDGEVLVTMTLTSPGCPLGPVIRGEAYAKLKEIPAVKDVDVQIVWSPPLGPEDHGQRRRADGTRNLVDNHRPRRHLRVDLMTMAVLDLESPDCPLAAHRPSTSVTSVVTTRGDLIRGLRDIVGR